MKYEKLPLLLFSLLIFQNFAQQIKTFECKVPESVALVKDYINRKLNDKTTPIEYDSLEELIYELEETQNHLEMYREDFGSDYIELKKVLEDYLSECYQLHTRSCPLCTFSTTPSTYCNILVRQKPYLKAFFFVP